MTIYIFSNIIYKAESQCERKLFTMPIMWSGVQHTTPGTTTFKYFHNKLSRLLYEKLLCHDNMISSHISFSHFHFKTYI